MNVLGRRVSFYGLKVLVRTLCAALASCESRRQCYLISIALAMQEAANPSSASDSDSDYAEDKVRWA